MSNGVQNHQRYAMQVNMARQFQHNSHAQHQNQQQQHHGQQDHNSHGMHGAPFGGHQHTMSSAGLSSSTPHFTPSHAQNGTPNNLQGGLGKPQSEHWAQQLQLAQQTREANQPHTHARVTNISKAANGAGRDEEREEQGRENVKSQETRQVWTAMDFSGQGLKAVSPFLFKYEFLDKLHLNNNKLRFLPTAIGRLRQLRHLDLSQNQLSDLPPQIGMLSALKTFLLFDNELSSLPDEVGYLYQLETLGIEGNPLHEDIRTLMMEQGTKGVISWLRENGEGTLSNHLGVLLSPE